MDALTAGITEMPAGVYLEAGLTTWQSEWDKNERLKADETAIDQYQTEAKRLEAIAPHLRVARWFLLPSNHILAWSLGTTDLQRQSIGIDAHELRDTRTDNWQAPGPIMFYCVSDANLRALADHYRTTFLNRVDNRRLTDVGFYVMPIKTTARQVLPEQGSFSFSASISYVCWPRMDEARLARLKPVLAPKFPPLAYFLPNLFDRLSLNENPKE
jgi:hypothetical protein